MLQRGRPSTIGVTSIRKTIWRADPPKHLTDAQREVWQITVNRLGHDYFPAEVLPLLERYVCTVVITRWLQGMLDDNSMTPAEHRKVMRDLAAHSTLMATLATKLRITSQSVRKQSKSKPKQHATPWQSGTTGTG